MASILQSIPAAAYPLGAGLLVTSSLFFGNIGLSLVGPVPIVKNELGPVDLSTRARLRVWRLFFIDASFYVVRGTALTALLHLSVPFLTSSPLARSLSIASAIISASVIGYTGVAILPTNSRLLALDKQDELSEAEDKETLSLISKWDRLHKVRFLLYGSAWATGLATLFAVFA